MTGKQSPDARLRKLSTPDKFTRRNVLKTGGAALTGLTAIGTASAQEDGLDAHTGSIEVVSKNEAKAEGQVTGMEGREIKVGCSHKYEDENKWHSGYYGTVHARHSVSFILTIIGLKPGKTCKCRVIACPKDEPDNVCKGETVEFDTFGKIQSEDEKKTTTKKNYDGDNGECPCDDDHKDRKHVTFHCPRAGWSSYSIVVTGQVSPCTSSCKPSKIPHSKVEKQEGFRKPYAEGSIWEGEAHSFLFTGDIRRVDTGADVEAFVNGRRI